MPSRQGLVSPSVAPRRTFCLPPLDLLRSEGVMDPGGRGAGSLRLLVPRPRFAYTVALLVMRVNRQFALEAYSHGEAVRGYSRAVGRVGLWKCERSIFRRHLPADGRILDLGCGAGRTTFGLYDEGYRNLLGVDFSPGMIRQARMHSERRRQRIRFRVGDACRLPFRARSF